MAVFYFELNANFQSCTTAKAIIAKIDEIISALLTTALTACINGDIVEYRIDTGQSVQNVTYRDPIAIEKTIAAYRRLRAMYVADINGRMDVVIPARNLIYKNGFINF